MQLQCINCDRRFGADEAVLLRRGSVFTVHKCPQCGKPVRGRVEGAAEPGSPPVPGWLLLTNQPVPQRLPLVANKRLVVGRWTGDAEQADVRIETSDTKMSRLHCDIEMVMDQRLGRYTFLVRDHPSRNGTWLVKKGQEDDRIGEREAACLMDGAELRLGNTRLRLEVNPAVCG